MYCFTYLTVWYILLLTCRRCYMSDNKNNDNKFYTCKYDRSFKEIMLKLSNRDILKLILEKILGVRITKIEENNIERNTGNIHVRRKYLDMLLTTNVDKIEIEVNACDEDYVHPRNASYICDIYSHNVLVKEKYTEDIQVIQINLSYGIKDEKCMRIYKLQDESGKCYVKNLTIYDVNMEYYRNIWYSKNEEEIEENKYMIMLDLEENDLKKLSKKDKVVSRYMEEIIKLNSNPEFREFMTYEMDQKIIQNTRLEAAEKKGIEQGAKERNIQIAKNMLKSKEPIDKIVFYTGLTKEEIEELN